MSVKENSDNNFNWVYYLSGLVFGVLTAIVIEGNYLFAIAGGIVGLLAAGLFLNALAKGRKY
ncbi:MAG: hypothetical protein H7325_01855 [Pedobacter sp.]|nr:hypothetical protein [Pedobacter sp.]